MLPVHLANHTDNEHMFMAAVRMMRQKGYIKLEDKIAYLAGYITNGGGTNFLEINTLKQVFDPNYKFHNTMSEK